MDIIVNTDRPISHDEISILRDASERTPEKITGLDKSKPYHIYLSGSAYFKAAESLIARGFFKYEGDNGTPDWEWYQKIYSVTEDGRAFWNLVKDVIWTF